MTDLTDAELDALEPYLRNLPVEGQLPVVRMGQEAVLSLIAEVRRWRELAGQSLQVAQATTNQYVLGMTWGEFWYSRPGTSGTAGKTGWLRRTLIPPLWAHQRALTARKGPKTSDTA